jgi:hypothetical protein
MQKKTALKMFLETVFQVKLKSSLRVEQVEDMVRSRPGLEGLIIKDVRTILEMEDQDEHLRKLGRKSKKIETLKGLLKHVEAQRERKHELRETRYQCYKKRKAFEKFCENIGDPIPDDDQDNMFIDHSESSRIEEIIEDEPLAKKNKKDLSPKDLETKTRLLEEWKSAEQYMADTEEQFKISALVPIKTRLEEQLLRCGYPGSGNEMMYDGIEGEMIPASIFIGICVYQRLKHLVEAKIHARSTGPRHPLTRQPVEGRAKNGGFKFGEMELWCMIAYGAMEPLRRRTFDQSDRVVVWICKDCGRIGYWDEYVGKETCPHCPHGTLKQVAIPYAFKLLVQEIESMLIRVKINIEPQEYLNIFDNTSAQSRPFKSPLLSESPAGFQSTVQELHFAETT